MLVSLLDCPMTWSLPLSLFSYIYSLLFLEFFISNTPTSAFLKLYSILFTLIWILLSLLISYLGLNFGTLEWSLSFVCCTNLPLSSVFLLA